jgi:DNA-binding transcriptional ArsR family regulator
MSTDPNVIRFPDARPACGGPEEARPAGGAGGVETAAGPDAVDRSAGHEDWILGDIAKALSFDAASHSRAARGLQPLREPLRRTLLETLAGRPQPMSRRLLDAVGGSAGDVHQRLRTLRQARLITVERHHIYKVDTHSLEALRRYFDLLLCAASLSPAGASSMPLDLDLALEALAEPTRRAIFEHIVIRPRRVGELAALLPVTRQNISHHVRVLGEAGLIRHDPSTLTVIVEALPQLRTYFDRLWLEASLGDTWLNERRVVNGDYGL